MDISWMQSMQVAIYSNALNSECENWCQNSERDHRGYRGLARGNACAQ